MQRGDSILTSSYPHAVVLGSGPRWLSAIVLVLANLAPLYGVIVLGWPTYPLILLFWVENVVIGILNAMQMVCANPRSGWSWFQKAWMVPFFCLHYGIFTAAHGAFIHQVFGGGTGPVREIFTPALWAARITALGLWAPIAVLASSHLFSFAWNYLRRGEFRTVSLDRLMMRPYLRVVVLHLVLFTGGMAAMRIGSPIWALLMLIAVKIAVDLYAHLREHRHSTARTV